MLDNWRERVEFLVVPLLKMGVKKGFFSGAGAGIYNGSEKEENRLVLTCGRTRYDESGRPVKPHTLFDLASLTKPLCTVLSMLFLLEQKTLHLQSPLGEVLPHGLREEKRSITIQQLLSHSSGFKAYKPYYELFQPVIEKNNTSRLIRLILEENLVAAPGEKCAYSDLGYILLGYIIETVSGLSLDRIFRQEIVGPLGLEQQIRFHPVSIYSKKPNSNTAATERCPWRNKILQGEVDDEHCWLMNGVAGHAGLFGSVAGVLTLIEHLLLQWMGKTSTPAYSNQLLKKALTRQYANQTWCLGFDTPSPSNSSAGRYFSPNSAGHLGFTGTSFWMDPDRELAVVLLTNRVHPTRKNEMIKKFRPMFHDAVCKAMDGK